MADNVAVALLFAEEGGGGGLRRDSDLKWGGGRCDWGGGLPAMPMPIKEVEVVLLNEVEVVLLAEVEVVWNPAKLGLLGTGKAPPPRSLLDMLEEFSALFLFRDRSSHVEVEVEVAVVVLAELFLDRGGDLTIFCFLRISAKLARWLVMMGLFIGEPPIV